jgi:hypothetical protein
VSYILPQVENLVMCGMMLFISNFLIYISLNITGFYFINLFGVFNSFDWPRAEEEYRFL